MVMAMSVLSHCGDVFEEVEVGGVGAHIMVNSCEMDFKMTMLAFKLTQPRCHSQIWRIWEIYTN